MCVCVCIWLLIHYYDIAIIGKNRLYIYSSSAIYLLYINRKKSRLRRGQKAFHIVINIRVLEHNKIYSGQFIYTFIHLFVSIYYFYTFFICVFLIPPQVFLFRSYCLAGDVTLYIFGQEPVRAHGTHYSAVVFIDVQDHPSGALTVRFICLLK